MKAKFLLIICPVLFFISCTSEPKKEDVSNDVKENPAKENKMTEMQQANDGKPKDNPYKDAKLSVKILNNDSIKTEPNPHGYGYEIYMYDSLNKPHMYIHQPHIPGINGLHGFRTRAQSQKAAEFIIYKIHNNIMPPAVTERELDSLGVLK